MSDFGDEVKRLRQAAKMTQIELAAATGISQSLIAMIESGKRKGTDSTHVNKLCEVFGVSLDHFAKYISPGVQVPPPPTAPGIGLNVIPAMQILGTVGAGPAINDPAGHEEYFEADKAFPESSKLYRVKGKSMEDAGIYDGDLVVVRELPLPKSGEEVVVWIASEDGHVCKWFKKRGASQWLEDAQGYRHYLEKDDVILGVYVGLIRQKAKKPRK